MEGLIVLAVIALYFVVLIGFTVAGYKIPARRGLSRATRWLGAAIGFSVIFLPVFWDTIPTLWLYRHYCKTEGGLKVYKTLEKWKQENPEVADTLVEIKAPDYHVSIPGVDDAYQLNQRFRWEIRNSTRPLGINMRDERLVDVSNGDVLAQSIEFSIVLSNVFASGIHSFRDIKLWLARTYCQDDYRSSGHWAFGHIKNEVRELGESK